jgi:hypothetical protein
MRAIAQIESSGNPNERTGSYKGLYQLSDGEFRKYGGRGSIYDPQENARVAGLKLADESNQVAQKLGRPLTPAEQYLVHQQGVGGAYAHLMNPNQPAWMSMASTAEGRQKGEAWARRAIWENVPDDMKPRFGSVDNITSGQFSNMWANKLASRMPPTPAPPLPPAQDVPPPPQIASANPQAPLTPPQAAPPVFPQQPQQPQQQVPPVMAGSIPGLFSQLPAQQIPQAPPIYYAPQRPIDLSALRQALASRPSLFPQGQS